MRLTCLLYGIYGIYGLLQKWKEMMLRELSKRFIRETLKDVSTEDFFFLLRWFFFWGGVGFLTVYGTLVQFPSTSISTPPLTSEQIRIVSVRVACRQRKVIFIEVPEIVKNSKKLYHYN